jgi:hypothetical protein
MYAHGEIIIGFFWGLWLLPFGYLAYKSGSIPKILGILLLLTCFGYLIDSALYVLSPNIYETVTKFTNVLMFIGEPLMLLWLVIFGMNKPKKKIAETRA